MDKQIKAPQFVVSEEEYVDLFARACDAICRTAFSDLYGIPQDPRDDAMWHTSDEARRIAVGVFEAIGLIER
jgi:hypothetical protein